MQKNFAWIANWKITHRCNLRCSYCAKGDTIPANQPDTADHRAIIDRIATYRPKFLNITGGEPTLVRDLPDLLAYARKLWNPSVYVVHNGSNPDALLPLLPNLTRVVVSLDGPGEENRRTKGIDGSIVLRKMGPMVAESERQGVGVSLNCVVLKSSLPFLRELSDQVHAAFPYVTLCYSPLFPPDHPESISNDGEDWKTFTKLYEDIRTAGRNVVHTFDHVRMHERNDVISCVNQYFTIRISPEGKISSCAMNVPIVATEYARVWTRAFSLRGMKKVANMAQKMWGNRMSGKIDFSCTTPCPCEMWFDLLLHNRTNDSIPIYLHGFSERVTEKELSEMAVFVRQHVNPDFNLDFFKREMLRSNA